MTEKLSGPHRAAWREALKEKPEFSLQQVTAALSRHGLGRVQEWERHGGNMINSVYKVTCSDGCYFLKIQFRPGFSLKAEHEATQLIRAATSLPVPDLSIVDEDEEPFGHPFLVTSELPGNPGRALFETADQPTQLRILKEYGRVVAQLHGIQLSESTLPQRDYRDWRDRIRNGFLDLEELIASLPTEYRSRIPTIARQLDQADAQLPAVPRGFLWGDAVMHNLLLDRSGQLTGVLDFENAAWGDLLMDQLHIESEFEVRIPREIYGRPEYRDTFWESYQEAGGTRPAPSATYLKVRKAVQCGCYSWFWNAARVLPPKLPQYLTELESVLLDLQA